MEASWCVKLGMWCPFVIVGGDGRQRTRRHPDGAHREALMMCQSIGHAHGIFHPLVRPPIPHCVHTRRTTPDTDYILRFNKASRSANGLYVEGGSCSSPGVVSPYASATCCRACSLS